MSIAEHLMPELAHDQSSLELLREQVAAGRTGLRAGAGFYEWTEARRAHIQEVRAKQLRGATLEHGD